MTIARRQMLGMVAAGIAGGFTLGGSRAHAAVSTGNGAIDLLSPDALTQGGWARGRTLGQSLTLDGEAVELTPDGLFFIAFDRDAARSATLAATLSDGRVVRDSLAIAPRDWRIEHVNVARLPHGPTEAFMALRRPELAQIAAARALETGSMGWRQNFIFPVHGRITGVFGSQRIYRGEPAAYHTGLDIAGHTGTPILAPAEGTVILAASHPFTLEGNLLMVDHGMGLNSAFLHCSALLVKDGDRVSQGQMIARIGMTGRATGPHLHWSMKWREARIDPILLTGPMT